MSEPVVIGIREVYDAVKEVKAALDQFASKTATEVALLQHRVTSLEKENEGNKARRWQLYVALVGAAVAIGIAILK